MRLTDLTTPLYEMAPAHNLHGFWITPEGKLHYVDHDQDLHHADIAMQKFQVAPTDFVSNEDDEGEDQYEALKQAYDSKWIRVSIFQTPNNLQVTVDVPKAPTRVSIQVLLRELAKFPQDAVFHLDDDNYASSSKQQAISKIRSSLNITEAPIGDFEHIGNWGDKDRNSSFRDPLDRRLLTNPKSVQKIKQKFGRTEHVLNMYFVNRPEANKESNREIGIVTPEQLQKMMPQAAKEILGRERDPEAINVIYTNNNGVNRAMMTAWIIAHRLGHAVQASVRYSSDRRNLKGAAMHWDAVYEDMIRTFRDVMQNGYNYSSPSRQGIFGIPDQIAVALLQQIGTTKAARESNLGGRPYEYMYEMFAQYILTGSIKFNDLPQHFMARFGASKQGFRLDPDYEGTNPFRDMGEYEWNGRFDSVLWDLHGQFLVM